MLCIDLKAHTKFSQISGRRKYDQKTTGVRGKEVGQKQEERKEAKETYFSENHYLREN